MYFDQIIGGRDLVDRLDGLSERVARIESKFAPEPERDHELEDKVRYLASKCDQLKSSNATLRDRLEVSQNRTLKVLEFLKIERRRVETRRETIRNLENSQKGLRQRVVRIGETNKILLERKQEIEREKERLSNEIARQEGGSPSLLEELTNARYLLSYWRNVSREQTGKIKAAEERAVEAESKLDQVRRFAENDVLGAHSKVAYIRNVVRP